VAGTTHILRETITSLESRLGHRQFLRVHRSTLVNVDRIKTLRPSLYGDYSILLRDGTKLTLSRGFLGERAEETGDGVAAAVAVSFFVPFSSLG
jgi:DNA-binding LytR/AlgR family response regulator